MEATANIGKPAATNDYMAIVWNLISAHESISVVELARQACDHHINSFELGLAVATLRGRGQLKVRHDGSIHI